jgi:hypothetical protein
VRQRSPKFKKKYSQTLCLDRKTVKHETEWEAERPPPFLIFHYFC